MYATSKLIIPPKPARDSPFIPKLRIRLRPSPNRDDLSSDLESEGENPSCDSARILSTGKDNNTPNLLTLNDLHNSFTLDPSSLSEPSCDNDAGKYVSKQLPCEGILNNSTRKSGTKRKQSPVLSDNLDLESPESFLTKINLKSLINRKTFYAFPLDIQQMLADLLPVYDRTKEISHISALSEEIESKLSQSLTSKSDVQTNGVWLHPTALSNEFFTKALQDFSNRQAKGEFAPRVRNRAGLRAHVGNRYRYSSFAISDGDQISYNSGSRIKKSPINRTSAQSQARRSSRQKNKTPASTTSESIVSVSPKSVIQSNSSFDDSTVNSSKSISTDATQVKSPECKKVRRVSKNSSGSTHPESVSIGTESLPQMQSELCSKNSKSVKENSEVSSPCRTNSLLPFDESTGAEMSKYPKSVDSEDCAIGDYVHSEAFNHVSVRLSPESGNGHTFSSHLTLRKTDQIPITGEPNDKHIEESVTFDSSNEKPTHARRLSLDSKFTVTSKKPTNVNNSNRSVRAQRSVNSTANDVSPAPSMPPPRQTKTLASMREKLRAKLLRKESERGMSGQSFCGLPGSMTPHPASGASGYFQSRNYPVSDHFVSFNETADKNAITSVSSPSFSTSVSPTPERQVTSQSTNLSGLLNETIESNNNLDTISPSSPYSAPSVDVLSPLVNFNSLPTEPSSSTSGHDTFSNCTQSYPSSPGLSTAQVTPIRQQSLSSYSPTLMHISQVHRQEQSTSAPPTPSMSHSGQNFTNYLHSYQPLTQINVGPSPLTPQRASQISPAIPVTTFSSPVSLSKVVTTQSLSLPSSNLHATETVDLPNPCDNSSMINSQPISVGLPLTSSCESSSSVISQTINKLPLVSDVSSVNSLGTTTSVTKLLTPCSRQNRPSTTTRAFFVDGDNLSEAVALLQSLNPKATITQQQFLLIPGANKSQMFLCRAPVTSASETTPQNFCTTSSTSTSQTVIPSRVHISGTPASIVFSNSEHSTTPSSVNTPVIEAASKIGVERSYQSYTTPVSEAYRTGNVQSLPYTEDSLVTDNSKPSDVQISRSLVYSKSINMSIPNGSPFPLNIFKPQPKSSEPVSDRSLLQVVKQVSTPSKPTVPQPSGALTCPARTLLPTGQNYRQPVSHPQLNISLLGSGGPVINNEVPILLVQDRHQSLRSQPPTRSMNVSWVHQNSFDQLGDLDDRPPMSLPILPTATVITTHAGGTGDLRRFTHSLARPTSSVHIPSNVSVGSHFGFQSIHSVQPTLSAANTPTSNPLFSGPTATIMSPCLPAVILSRPLTLQSNNTNTPCHQNLFTRSLPSARAIVPVSRLHFK